MLSKDVLDAERSRLFRAARSGVSLPVAGAVYWLSLGVAGLYLSPRGWSLVAFFTSGLIFPLGVALQKPFGARLFVPSVLSPLFGFAMIPIALTFAVTIPAFYTEVSLVPLALSVGMTVHWPVIGWIYGKPGFIVHAIFRTVAVCALWFAMPNARFVAIPFAVGAIYLATVAWLLITLAHLDGRERSARGRGAI